MDENKIVFKRQVVERGATGLALQFPKEILDYLNIKKEDMIGILPEVGKHGKFIAIWKLSEQEGSHESDIQSE